jgi:hypothetical protein
MSGHCFCYLFTELQNSLQEPQTEKALEAAVSFSQSLSQWAYIALGGSVAFLLKDLKSRPTHRLLRYSFWAFIPGWLLLASSIYQGTRVHRTYVAYLMSSNPQREGTILNFNRYAHAQISCMQLGLFLFGAWLVFFLAVWISVNSPFGTETR